jgi:hypothetical protein
MVPIFLCTQFWNLIVTPCISSLVAAVGEMREATTTHVVSMDSAKALSDVYSLHSLNASRKLCDMHSFIYWSTEDPYRIVSSGFGYCEPDLAASPNNLVGCAKLFLSRILLSHPD